jgi:cytochrome c peroxidase
MPVRRRPPLHAALLVALCAPIAAALGLPPVPVPAENPVTEPKRVLGKILFWDEQLSSDESVACGTCHRPAFGGADPRVGRHTGTDPGTIDDVLGSPGIASYDADDRPIEHPGFGFDPQVTPRATPSNFGGLWANELFWDGRAGQTVRDPETFEIVIERHGALEAQALATLLNDAEMAKQDQTWGELGAKLERTAPLALASDWPEDVRRVIERHRTYPELFQAAFGDPRITPIRIAFALATYQRTLVADQTPWDRFQAGDAAALSERELYGWRAFESLRCASCHTPPLFTNDDFFSIGLRRSTYDPGRAGVTHDPEDAGEMKVPSLRNVGLKPRFMHTGQLGSLSEAIGFYVTSMPTEERDDIPGSGAYSFSMSAVTQRDLLEFLDNALTDPRVAGERFPFDRPRLRSEREARPEQEAGPTPHRDLTLSGGASR